MIDHQQASGGPRRGLAVRMGRRLLAILVLAACAVALLPPHRASAGQTPTPKAPIAIAAGRATWSYSASDGVRFGPDQFFSGGASRRIEVKNASTSAPQIEDTEDPPLYQFFRSGAAFSYAIPLENGLYVLTLGFTEPNPATKPGERVFDVSAEGEILLDEFDILAATPAAQRAVTRRFAVKVADGVLNVQFKAGKGEALVSHLALSAGAQGAADRAYLVNVLTTIAGPVLQATAKGKLHDRLPVHDWELSRKDFTHYEAFARALAGVAPWLELGPDSSAEGQLRARFIGLARQALINATNPTSPDYMNFDGEEGDQPLVEAAYLASALLSAPRQLWEPLNAAQKKNVLDALRASRTIELRRENNWVLFPAMAEAALWNLGAEYNHEPIAHALEWMEKWYEGDGVYGDGWDVAWDYYNSYVIHPMLLQVLRVAAAHQHAAAGALPQIMERAQRNASILERQISPEGTLPLTGRSSNYRFAAFYHLAYMALIDKLPEGTHPGAVRSGITAVVRRMYEAPGTFDAQGWLQAGAVGYQPGLTEVYNATGSFYVALTGLVHLGLPPDHPFWLVPDAPWTQKRIWSGQNVQRDHALEHGLHIERRKE